MSGGYGGDTPVECDVWLRIVAQVGLSAPACCDEFAMHQTAVFWSLL
jgi:hypothetical protein